MENNGEKKIKVTKKAIKDFLKSKLGTDAGWALRALKKIYENQTADEQASGSTHYINNIGFTGCDAEILTSFAGQLDRRGFLTEKQMNLVFKKMPKYWGQILEISDRNKLEAMVGGVQ